MNKVVIVCLALFVIVSCDFNDPPDYEYKTIVGDSIYSDWKKERKEAIEAAYHEFERSKKNTCRQRISNGWALFKIKNEGVVNCEQTSEGHHCRLKNVEFECRRVSEFFP